MWILVVCKKKTLAQCNKLGDRFGIFDLREGSDFDASVETFRDEIGTSHLKYGAAYTPHLKTNLPKSITFQDLDNKLHKQGAPVSAGWAGLVDLPSPSAVTDILGEIADTGWTEALEASLAENFPLYKAIREGVATALTTIPPSGAVAGVYASVDRERGVWKAPANVSLNSISGLTEAINNADQEELNVDVVAGKSINAIRAFTGRGIMVWGARTLAGNDNEWRYVNVRRFFNMVEESAKKSTHWAVFEPNDANLWTKIRAMIENYLRTLWRDGALAGAKPEHAFFVDVGLGATMSAQDILEGRLIVKIGLAVVRPAEFIILQFSHKLQES
jgi:hypothetical protein